MADTESPPPVAATPPRKQRARYLAIGVALVLVAAGAVAAWAMTRPDKVTVSGTITLTNRMALDQNFLTIPGECRGFNSFSDIAEGAAVTIRGASGKVVAVTKLAPGKPGSGRCTFAFSASDVEAAGFYGVEVAHRGSVQFSREQASAGKAELSLGG